MANLWYRTVPTYPTPCYGRVSLYQPRPSAERRTGEPQAAYKPVRLSRTIYGRDVATVVLYVVIVGLAIGFAHVVFKGIEFYAKVVL